MSEKVGKSPPNLGCVPSSKSSMASLAWPALSNLTIALQLCRFLTSGSFIISTNLTLPYLSKEEDTLCLVVLAPIPSIFTKTLDALLGVFPMVLFACFGNLAGSLESSPCAARSLAFSIRFQSRFMQMSSTLPSTVISFRMHWFASWSVSNSMKAAPVSCFPSLKSRCMRTDLTVPYGANHFGMFSIVFPRSFVLNGFAYTVRSRMTSSLGTGVVRLTRSPSPLTARKSTARAASAMSLTLAFSVFMRWKLAIMVMSTYPSPSLSIWPFRNLSVGRLLSEK
mmetsp:Transcript_5187/g.13065  ORF Transcript_5187/g.13065 Transcript_5187/m.13065 type:complete len:281 (-) Transcript_5187:77-919(-)